MNQKRLNAERNEVKSNDPDVKITDVSEEDMFVKRKEGSVELIHGANHELYDDLSGKDVAHVRKNLRDIFNIPKDAVAMVNGEEVKDDFVLENKQTLEFFKPSGVKGSKRKVTRTR